MSTTFYASVGYGSMVTSQCHRLDGVHTNKGGVGVDITDEATTFIYIKETRRIAEDRDNLTCKPFNPEFKEGWDEKLLEFAEKHNIDITVPRWHFAIGWR